MPIIRSYYQYTLIKCHSAIIHDYKCDVIYMLSMPIFTCLGRIFYLSFVIIKQYFGSANSSDEYL